MRLNKGDKVYYVGADQKVQQDYSAQELTVIAGDWMARSLVCATADGRWLVGVRPEDLQLPNCSSRENCSR